MSTVPAGYITPTTLGPVNSEDVTTIYGTYTPTAVSATGYWTPASLTIDADTPWVADGDNWVYNQEFVWTEVDYYNYYVTLKVNEGTYTGKANWNVQGPAGSYTVPGGTTGFQVVDETQESVPENAIDGAYQMLTPAPTGYYWEAVELTTGDFLARSKGGRAVINLYAPDMMWMLLEEDQPTYTVYMTTVPAGYITPATLGPVTDPADIYGTYTPTDVSTTGYWTPASLTIDADTEWVADNDNNWVFSQEFVWTETTVYQLTVASTYLGVDEPGYEIIKDEVPTGQFTPWTFESEDQAALYGTYTLENVTGFAWCPQEWIVDASTWAQTKEYAPATIVFDRQQIYTWTVLVLDLNTSSPIEGASIWFDDGVNPPTVVATTIVNGTYTFTCPGDYPGAGTYYVTAAGYNVWDPINVVQTVETMTENLPNSTFYGDWEDGPTPVVLSSFTATLTGQFYVQLSWTSQTETQMMGYRVYRNTSAEQSTSELIDNPMIPATNTSSTQNYTVVDDDVLIGQTYYYWLEAVDYNSSSFHGPVSVTVTGNVPPVLPEVTEMRNAYPNPFKANGSTNIEVSLKAGDTGTLTIYNVQGQLVKTVSLTEGNHMVNWNGRDSRGNACGSGIYFYKLSTQSMNQTKKMVIVK
ncbi:MAG: T9SS type A sorting domain-containing protein [Candidatus Cloacimonetes bacterium]|nr:T9SS type A sorting domain-containing protein [Candidatus Cloacimonadota bacterium]MDY0366178.1 T9SS type A sorting domain-containing protein [Candidatus Syntrophosphaera sp.]